MKFNYFIYNREKRQIEMVEMHAIYLSFSLQIMFAFDVLSMIKTIANTQNYGKSCSGRLESVKYSIELYWRFRGELFINLNI